MDQFEIETGGVTTVSLLVLLLVGTAVGALVGLFLAPIAHGAVLALIAGLCATIVAAIVRNVLVAREIGVGPDDAAIPGVVLVYAAVASLAGSLAGEQLARLVQQPFPVWVGALAGLLSSILMGLLIITYHMTCERRPRH